MYAWRLEGVGSDRPRRVRNITRIGENHARGSNELHEVTMLSEVVWTLLRHRSATRHTAFLVATTELNAL